MIPKLQEIHLENYSIIRCPTMNNLNYVQREIVLPSNNLNLPMKTSVSQPIYQEAMAINRSIQHITRGYHSNGTFNLAFKIKDDILEVCNNLDQGVAARFEHTFESYYKKAIKEADKLLEHMRVANVSRMIRGGFPEEIFERVRLLKMKLILLLELYQSEMPLDYITLSNWARQKIVFS